MTTYGYRTSASCKIAVVGRALEVYPATLVAISTDGGEVVCEKPVSSGTEIDVTLDELSDQDNRALIIGNEKNTGLGYRLQIRLRSGSWPYNIYAALMSSALSGSPGVGSTPACLRELGLEMPCSNEDIETAFDLKVRKVHPDRGGDLEAFVRLRGAYLEALDLVGAKR